MAKYKRRISERKREVWERDLEKMNKDDIFGDAYRLIRGKRSGEVVLTTMKKGDGQWTKEVEDTLEYILDELLPQDIVNEDTVEQARMRREVLEGEGRQEGVVRNLEVVEREVEEAIKRFKNKKAPGERVRERRLETVREVKYLGVWIGEGMKGDRHVVEVGEKVLKVVNAFGREMRVGGGLTYSTILSLYRKVVEPGMVYGVEFWGKEVLRREILRKKWLAVQKKVLIKMISAYRTISAEAACVVAGVEPIDLRIEMQLEVKEDMRGGMDKRESEERRKVVMVEKWQQRWRESQKGRVT